MLGEGASAAREAASARPFGFEADGGERVNNRPCVFFDLGDTLADIRPLIVDLAGEVGHAFQLPREECDRIAVQWIRSSWERMPRGPGDSFRTEIEVATDTLARILQARGLEADAPFSYTLLRHAWDVFEGHVTLREGISHEWLSTIRDLSAGLGLITDGDDENVARLLRRLDIAPFFECVVTSESVRRYKPDPLLYRTALNRLGTEAASSLFVSDTELDLEGAIHVGMAAALLPRDLADRATALPDGALLLRSPRDLNPLLERYRDGGSFTPDRRPRHPGSRDGGLPE